jgi:hypothetical protein
MRLMFFLIAAFCRLAKSLSHSQQMGWLVGAVGIELKAMLKTRMLLILRIGKTAKPYAFAEATYRAGTRSANAKRPSQSCLTL